MSTTNIDSKAADKGRPITVFAEKINLTYRVITDENPRFAFGLGKRRVDKRALTNISFNAREGEFIGLIGRNGSGKSSLLRVLAGLETATSGTVLTAAKPQLLGVGAVLNQAISGEENIRLGLLAMGYTPKEVEERKEVVIKLSQLGDAIFTPLKTYSSGMAARLRFSISVAAEPKILMVDEALATGDATFQERSNRAMRGLIRKTGTVFLVNHSTNVIQKTCNRVIWLEQGQIVSDGLPKAVTERYREFAARLAKGDQHSAYQMINEMKETFVPA